MHFTKSSLLAAAFASSASAYSATQRTFAVNHFYGKGPLVSGRMDPLTNPGEASGHVHAVQGGNAFALNMTDDQPLKSTCTSSLVKNDKSNYWTPALYFQDPKTGSLESVDMFYMNVYYFFEPTTDKIQAFPQGLRMLIGNPSLRSPPATSTNILDLANGTPQPVQWTCPRQDTSAPLYPANSDGLHGSGIGDTNNKGAGVGFPDQNCDGYASPLRADVHFPSCYNPAAGLDNYKENMQFPTHGNCPEGWIHTPHLFYEVYWNTPVFKDRWSPGQGTQPFVLSNGDPTGYSLHGDFIAGWDEATLQQVIDNCDAGDSGMDKCPGLIGGLNDPSTSCNIQSPIQETITGTLSALPGNNPIGQWGVAPAGGAPPASSVAVAPASTAAPVGPTPAAPTALSKAPGTKQASAPTAATSAGAAPAPSGSGSSVAGWTSIGCYQDNANNNRALTGIQFADVGLHAVTNTKCIAYCEKKGFTLSGTEYGGQCFCGNDFVTKTKIDDSHCSTPCEGDGSQVCGGANALTVYSSGPAQRMRRSVRARHLG